ncbi:MAG TPA: hypothetical protein ENK44_11345 [Caldithrix abyssi]|uniref:Putative zinc-finger domain-containing protein n=1 Tax=Caldithrix abyssi TaxID=187145 RepID=A0A7V4U2U6_CALAY|nr:hypothetical protein [Caldithrix abyssi]
MKYSEINCQQAQILIMGKIDGELPAEENRILDEHLAVCSKCKYEYERFVQLKKGTSEMKFEILPEVQWDAYWDQVYNKIERGIGWILFSIGFILVASFWGYQALEGFFMDPKQPTILKIGVGALTLGLIFLFVSVLREKLMVKKVDKYRSVQR